MAMNPDVPLHYQIYQQMRAEIEDGLWTGRGDFPGEEDLAQRFGVSVITTRKALTRLAEERWIDRGRGRRSQVIPRTKAAARSNGSPNVFPLRLSHPYSYKLLSHGLGVPSAEACQAFGVPAGSWLWQCSRLRTFRGALHSVTYNVQRPEIGSHHSLANLRKLPMAQLLTLVGKEIAQVTRRLSAAPAPVAVAAALNIPVQHPTQLHTFTMRDIAGEVVEWVRIYLHPDESSPVEVLNLEDGCWRPTVTP